MIVDASAIVAIILEEPEAEPLADRLSSAASRWTHPVSIYEASLAIGRETGREVAAAQRVVERLLAKLNVRVVEVGAAEAAAAIAAHERYGKGRHPARLNMGDCFSYACARVRGMPLLYKGDDFARTDLA